MKKLKKIAVKALSLAVAAVTALSVGLNASAAGINYKWTFDRSSSDPYQRMGWRSNSSTNYSVDSKVHSDNSWYSIKIENTNYCSSLIERTYNVQPKTTYRFSAMVKYSGYQLNPEAKTQNTGACIGKAPFYDGEATNFYPNESGYSVSSDWTLLEYEFTTAANETAVNLCLQNGGNCKGTAWFSDVKLEKAELTNNWDVLVVIFNNIDANIIKDGKTVRHTASLRENDVKDINSLVLDKLPETLKALSNNKMNINSIDRYYTDEPLTEKDLVMEDYYDSETNILHGYSIDFTNSTLISKLLDPYLEKKHYEQILVFAPFNGIAGGWWGLTGARYKGVHFSQFTNSWDGAFKASANASLLVIHEMLHGLENDSIALIGDKTPNLHDKEKLYSADMSNYDWYKLYLNSTLPDGKKLDQSVFYSPNGKYTLVDSDMTTGTGITPGSSSVLPPAPKTLKVESAGDDEVKISWNAVPGADGYQLGLFNNTEFKETWWTHDFEGASTSERLSKILKDKAYNYGIRTVATVDGKTVYSDWTTLTYTHTGVSSAIIHGDVNNDGAFNLVDVTAALRMCINETALDERTLNAAGIIGKKYFDLSDVTDLLRACLRS